MKRNGFSPYGIFNYPKINFSPRTSGVNMDPDDYSGAGFGVNANNFRDEFSDTMTRSESKPENFMSKVANTLNNTPKGAAQVGAVVADSFLRDDNVYDQNDIAGVENVGSNGVSNVMNQAGNLAMGFNPLVGLGIKGASDAIRMGDFLSDRSAPKIQTQNFGYDTDNYGNVGYGNLGQQHDNLEDTTRQYGNIKTNPKLADFGVLAPVAAPIFGGWIRRHKNMKKQKVLDQVRNEHEKFATAQQGFNRAKQTSNMANAVERSKQEQARKFLNYA